MSLKISDHKHYWRYLQSTWQGRDDNEVAVARYCKCGVKQMAFSGEWRPVSEGYADIIAACNRKESYNTWVARQPNKGDEQSE